VEREKIESERLLVWLDEKYAVVPLKLKSSRNP
jgi:hypothetical protein